MFYRSNLKENNCSAGRAIDTHVQQKVPLEAYYD